MFKIAISSAVLIHSGGVRGGRFCLLFLGGVPCWDTGYLDLFDMVEVDRNSYKLMGQEFGAATPEVRRAFKKLVPQLHTDANPSPNAEIDFRQLAAINEVLKNKKKRVVYYKVLVEGLPNWKSPTLYFRRMRNIHLGERLCHPVHQLRCFLVEGLHYPREFLTGGEEETEENEEDGSRYYSRKQEIKLLLVRGPSNLNTTSPSWPTGLTCNSTLIKIYMK